MLVFPKAKINLGLFITGKRPDEYHNIETVFYPVNLCDALEMVAVTGRKKKDTLEITGYKLPGNTDDNIVIKAACALRKNYHFPWLRIHLHKAIPAGAGLGGGSSDAAFMLRAINRTFDLSISPDELKKIAASLGSDSPFFIDSQPAFASGRGEILTPLSTFLTGFYIVLINPGMLISTKDAYENCIPAKPEMSLIELIRRPISEWKELITNDFEKTVFLKYPEIKRIKQRLYESGAIYSSMSGSGSTVYGIFFKQPVIPSSVKRFVIYTGEL